MTLRFDDVRLFLEVLERRSFAAGARALGVSAPAASKRIAALEANLGTQLLLRTTRRVAPTDAGRLLHEQVGHLPRLLAEAEERVRDAQAGARGRLHVVMPTYFASSGFHHEVIPRYLSAHPEVHLTVSIVGEPLDHLGDDFDLLVAGRFPHERFPDSPHVRRRLLAFRGVLLAAPAYLEKHGSPRHPRDLERHNCISYPRRDWHFVEPKGASVVVRTRGTLTTDSNAMLYAATMSGIGIAYSFPYFFDRELEDGRVVEVLPRFTRGSFVDIQLFYPRARYLPRRARAFIDALADHFSRAR